MAEVVEFNKEEFDVEDVDYTDPCPKSWHEVDGAYSFDSFFSAQSEKLSVENRPFKVYSGILSRKDKLDREEGIFASALFTAGKVFVKDNHDHYWVDCSITCIYDLRELVLVPINNPANTLPSLIREEWEATWDLCV